MHVSVVFDDVRLSFLVCGAVVCDDELSSLVWAGDRIELITPILDIHVHVHVYTAGVLFRVQFQQSTEVLPT